MNQNNKLLFNVVFIRNILIVLLVFYHAFAIYSGAWETIAGFPKIKVYWWLDKLSYAFMLELFVFVSGYVYGYQVRIKGESKLQAKNLFWGKFKRLIIPSVVFGLFYVLLYGNISQPFLKTVNDVLIGVGHMWFLPMLFWCFVGVWFIEKVHLKPKWTIVFLFLAVFGSFLPLPFRMGYTLYYLLFFYVGYAVQRYGLPLDRLYTKHIAIITTVSFVILFTILTLMKEQISAFQKGIGDNQIVEIMGYAIGRLIQVIYASAGILMTVTLVGCYLKKHSMSNWFIQVSELSFGVYLFQQFILIAIYYHSPVPELLGYWYLPWVSFLFALISSSFLSWLFRKTHVGRFLIG